MPWKKSEPHRSKKNDFEHVDIEKFDSVRGKKKKDKLAGKLHLSKDSLKPFVGDWLIAKSAAGGRQMDAEVVVAERATGDEIDRVYYAGLSVLEGKDEKGEFSFPSELSVRIDEVGVGGGSPRQVVRKKRP